MIVLLWVGILEHYLDPVSDGTTFTRPRDPAHLDERVEAVCTLCGVIFASLEDDFVRPRCDSDAGIKQIGTSTIGVGHAGTGFNILLDTEMSEIAYPVASTLGKVEVVAVEGVDSETHSRVTCTSAAGCPIDASKTGKVVQRRARRGTGPSSP